MPPFPTRDAPCTFLPWEKPAPRAAPLLSRRPSLSSHGRRGKVLCACVWRGRISGLGVWFMLCSCCSAIFAFSYKIISRALIKMTPPVICFPCPETRAQKAEPDLGETSPDPLRDPLIIRHRQCKRCTGSNPPLVCTRCTYFYSWKLGVSGGETLGCSGRLSAAGGSHRKDGHTAPNARGLRCF